MPIQTKVADLKVGDIILDGIASRVEAHIPDDPDGLVYMHLKDGNGYTSVVRWAPGFPVTHFSDWSDEDWAAFLLL